MNRKLLLMLGIFLVLALVFAACGTPSSEAPAEEAPAAEEPAAEEPAAEEPAAEEPAAEEPEEEEAAEEPMAEEEVSNTIVDVAVNDGRFGTLVTAVTAAGLAETLSGEGPFTVFAPTDDAFAALPEGTVESLLEDPQGALTDVLLYHVVDGKVMASDVVELESAATLSGEEIAINVSDEGVFLNENVAVVITDVEADNGVIHVVDAVLLPPSMMAEEPMESDMAMVAAESCDYGGKILSIEAVDDLTVQFNLCKPDPAFLAKVAFTPFGIQPAEYIAETGGTGVILEKPIGTGPYMVDEWVRGDSVIYKRFDDYWGEPAIAETAVLRWNAEGAARLLELQAGTVDQITNVSPDDFEAVEADPNLQLLPYPNPNILYVGFTNTFAPFDNPDVRKAVAMGIDRQRLVDNFYPAGSEVASHFTPCSIPNGCAGEEWYEFDPEAARQMLADAGFPDGFETTIYYRDVFRVYLPEPGLVAVDIQAQLEENLGITANVEVMESGAFIDESTSGRLDGIHLLGWGADYPHVTNFLDFHFSADNPQFGDAHPEIYEKLQEASTIADADEAAPLYEEANNAIKELVPMVPIVHGAAAHAAKADLAGVQQRPFGADYLHLLDNGTDTVVYMQNAEPISLYCADETDGESLRPCQQTVETLYDYELDSGNVRPALATSCEGNEDSTVFVCTLREGVMFHDGSMLDSGDVVASWAAGIDVSNPYHTGNTGSFDYYSYLWDGLMNQPAEE